MANYKCGHCGYSGPCYGTMIGNHISHPWCTECGKNDKLEPVKRKPHKQEAIHATD